MQDSCFVDNEFFGGGVVVLNQSIVESLSNNYVDDSGIADLDCQFAYVQETGECLPPDSSACTLLGIPTINQTSAPASPATNTTTDTDTNTTTDTDTDTNTTTNTTTNSTQKDASESSSSGTVSVFGGSMNFVTACCSIIFGSAAMILAGW
jgi:carbohydrate-binding DOMON domain-containing protein